MAQGAAAAAPPAGAAIAVHVGPAFEECLELTWDIDPGSASACFDEFVVEMVIDHAYGSRESSAKLAPAPDAMVKRVSMGCDRTACIQNMPSGRNFLVTVVGRVNDKDRLRASWTHASTLCAKTRKNGIVSLDPMGNARRDCRGCSCPGYIPFAWTANGFEKSRCRRCGCPYTSHVLVEAQEILEKRTAQARRRLGREPRAELPPEAVDWDERECMLWFGTEGRLHPRRLPGPEAAEAPGAPARGQQGQQGQHQGGQQGRRVSVVTPTVEARQHFHRQLWACFEAQAWPDKELVVVETYAKRPSAFLEELAAREPRLVYLKFQCRQGEDWSIGTKRNICAHAATGELIANFDDDDLYAPSYLSTMVSAMEEQSAQAITLSGWYVCHTQTNEWKFCDPIAWGLTKGHDESDEAVRTWAYGYGFSYVFRRQAGLDFFCEDINFGEDYGFMTQLQRRKGPRSVALFHDDFGICAHIQHGGNTSNSIPLRDVPEEEALDLAVMELGLRLEPPSDEHEALYAAFRRAPRGRQRRVAARLCGGDWPAGAGPRDAAVQCAVGATVAEFLRALERELNESCEGATVYRVPPAGAATSDDDATNAAVSETERDDIAATVLGIAFLADLPEAEDHLQPETKSGRQWRKLLETAKCPLERWSRIDLRTKQLWLLPPARTGAADGAETWDRREASVVVRGARWKSSAKALRGVSTFEVVMPVGADVGLLRWVLGRSLPAAAKVLADRPNGDSITLKDADALPEAITVTDFKGQRSYFVHLSQSQTRAAMLLIRAFLRQPATQQKLQALEAEAGENRRAYHLLVSRLYVQDVYPVISRHFGFQDDALDGETFPHLCGPHIRATIDLSFLWVEVETLAKLWSGAAEGFQCFKEFRSHMTREPMCTWEEFYAFVSPMNRDRVEAMDLVRKCSAELLEPVSESWGREVAPPSG